MNTQKSETFLKAKELVDAIEDIDYLLGQYKNGMDNGSDKNCCLQRFFDKVYHIIHKKHPEHIKDEIHYCYSVPNSSMSSDFMVSLIAHLIRLKAK